eukprot:1202756-Rhodomonas_salina.3
MLLPDAIARALAHHHPPPPPLLRSPPIPLRACYAMSGTDLPNGANRLRACYAVSGTDLAYAATRRSYGPQHRGGGTIPLRDVRY